MKPSYTEVSNLLAYDPESGLLTWKINRKGKAMAGAVAGYPEIRTKKPSYVRVTIFNKRYQAHHIAVLLMTGEWPAVVDHDDRNGLNNKWNNLVISDTQSNNRNRSFKGNFTGVTAVHKNPKSKGYYVNVGGLYRGSCATIEEAKALRDCVYKDEGYHPKHGEIK